MNDTPDAHEPEFTAEMLEECRVSTCQASPSFQRLTVHSQERAILAVLRAAKEWDAREGEVPDGTVPFELVNRLDPATIDRCVNAIGALAECYIPEEHARYAAIAVLLEIKHYKPDAREGIGKGLRAHGYHIPSSWVQERGRMREALVKARPVVQAMAELAQNNNSWARGIPLNALDAIDAALTQSTANGEGE